MLFYVSIDGYKTTTNIRYGYKDNKGLEVDESETGLFVWPGP